MFNVRHGDARRKYRTRGASQIAGWDERAEPLSFATFEVSGHLVFC